jgi:hypothetical protein
MPNTPLANGLLIEMAAAEAEVFDAYNKLQDARTRYQVMGRKYAALRDLAEESLGTNPYAEAVTWPSEATTKLKGYSAGEFRYIHMPLGRAIINELKGADRPKTLGEIYAGLHRGEAETTPRAVNAALMKLANVEKVEGGYRYNPPEEEVDEEDLPFE